MNSNFLYTPGTSERPGTLEALKDALRKPGDASLAVAYWGKGAVEKLGLQHRSGKTRIICWLSSGACNPNEIKKLITECRGVSVKMCDRLHAKVYIFPSMMVVGSSNASANGLGEEGADTESNIEASVRVSGLTAVRDAQQWFDRLWDDLGESNQVDVSKLDKQLDSLWKANQRRANRSTLLKSIRMMSEGTRRKLRILVYTKPPSEGGKAAYRRMNPTWVDAGTHPWYEDWDGTRARTFEPGDVVIDYQASRRSLSYGGMWEVKVPKLLERQTKDEPSLILVSKARSYRGCRLPPKERNRIKELLKDHLDRVGWKPQGKDRDVLFDRRFDHKSLAALCKEQTVG